ncbi:MAG: DUF4097 domain-containing protein [Fimbriimonadales bacterium]|nr:DUF4097 domain-containing protein [Fimbriimonadales bacterium]
MKEEIARIMRLVQDGKLSPEDGAELIAAFAEERARQEPEAPKDQPEGKEPFKSLVELVESIGRDVSSSVHWRDVASQVRASARKAVETVKATVEEIKAKGGLFGAQAEKTFDLPLPAIEGKVLVVETHSGDVRVLGGSEGNRVVAKARVGGSDLSEAKARAQELDLVIEESESRVVVRAPEAHQMNMDFEVHVAGKVPVEVRTISGEVRIEGTGANCRASTTSGDIRVRSLQGRIELSTVNGDILVEKCPASDFELESKSGDVLLRSSGGSANIRAASGDVHVASFDGRALSVEAVTGDVAVDLEVPLTGVVTVRTVNGDARVSLPGGSDCRVALSTLRGDIAAEIDLLDKTDEGQRLTGRLGNGTGSLDVSAVNGDIDLRQRFVPSVEE